MVVDIHGRRENYPTLFEFLPNNSFKKKYLNFLKDKTIMEFKNDAQLTLAEDLDKNHVPCLEIEIRKDGRFPAD